MAWGTNYGRSAALCIAVIEKIRYHAENPDGYGPLVEVDDPALASGYKLVLRPIKSTGRVSYIDTVTGSREWRQNVIERDPDRYRADTKMVTHVKNVVKLDD